MKGKGGAKCTDRHKKVRLGRVEQNELDRALDLLEWGLGMSA
jgi:hypothetical protein